MSSDLIYGLSQPIEDLERPTLDDCSYRVITLLNKLEVLLIHDGKTDKASAAMDVNVGSFSDAKDMPGIAHAVEHLLFMGTEKYIKENEYRRYLASFSGHSNAYTDATSTNYYFELSASKSSPASSKAPSPSATQEHLPVSKDDSTLWGALDRFGQFFICPLFLEDTLDREIKAVDSENKKNLQDDTRRLNQLDKSLSNPEHPYNHFSTGSWKTLHDEPIASGVKIREEFMKFHSKHYSANRMKLVVLGREDLDTLEEWVDEIFSKVPNKDLPRQRWNHVPVYTERELLTQTFARPVFESRTLELSFLYRDEEDFYETHPSRYLSHLIGHEGSGSIVAYIKAKGWATSLWASGYSLCPGSGIFSINVKLTEEGLENYKEVTKIVFQYIALIREKDPQKWVVDEQIRISEVDFRFKQKSPPSQTTSALGSVMQKPYPRKMLLSGPAVIRKFDAKLISEAMDFLRPENLRINVVSQDFPGGWDQKEKWYGTEYKTGKIPDDFLAEIKAAFEGKERPAELHFPRKNEFIPTRLGVEKKEVDEPLKHPKLIRNDDRARTWWKKDDQFWVPKAHVHIRLATPLPYLTARNAAMTTLYRELVDDALVEYSYDADISGLVYSLSAPGHGLGVTVRGYNDKLHVLLEKVLVSLRDLQVREDRYKIVVDRLQRGWRNWEYGQPFHQVGTFSKALKVEVGKSYLVDELLKELEGITPQDVQQFIPQILSQCHIEVLAHGNLYKEEALQITDLVEKTLKPRRLPASDFPILRSLVLPSGSNFIYERQLKDPANVNHCIEYTLYLGNRSDPNIRARQLLIAQMTDEPAFNQLRTIEQLGYVVFSGSSAADNWAGYRLLIQSEKDCRYLEGRIEHFLTTFGKTLDEMPEEEFEGHKRAVASKRLEKLKNLGQEDSRFWTHITSDAYDFMQAEVDVAHVEPLTKANMQQFYNEFIHPNSQTRAKFSVHLIAQSKPKEASIDEKKTQTAATLATILAEEKIISSQESLSARLSDVASQDALVDAIFAHLEQDLKLDAEKKDKVFDEAKAALGFVDDGVKTPEVLTNGDLEAAHGKPVLITDMHAWRSGLQLSTGVKPVRNLEEYTEDAAKL
ncbi:LuxS/MPP-like metallohydrolase [Corynespora cassiicola Philippines]|uniref:LuxS/MPP-like metallohydrolase n=1 Tax=Corynespora cassiicola Philippines TaxID=1448308 RepID=A0A2T2N0J8_CORCC|nr:LuxS/MPP-like metallohydrolase [Corynespora cassiicola Philippines]